MNITRENLPVELKYKTVEYVIPQTAPFSPSLIVVIDTCLPKNEFAALKQLLVCADLFCIIYI
jgi:hypothetical protein